VFGPVFLKTWMLDPSSDPITSNSPLAAMPLTLSGSILTPDRFSVAAFVASGGAQIATTGKTDSIQPVDIRTNKDRGPFLFLISSTPLMLGDFR
jgi:hypothetical protein